jgi:AcrR family transcriptional regulator
MFKLKEVRSEQTRESILESALQLFRQRGIEGATMREIAQRAGVALGAAYYYFPGKEAIVQAYYERVQAEHARRVEEALKETKLDFGERLRIVFHSKLEILKDDRPLLAAIFRYTGEPLHPLSCLGPATRSLREESIGTFRRALDAEDLPADLAKLLPVALWALHMGVLVYFIYDNSGEQQRTRRLVDGAIELIARLLSLAKFPLFRPFRGRLATLLEEAGLLEGAIPIPTENAE